MMHLRRRLAHLERIGHTGCLDSSAGLVGDPAPRGRDGQNQDRQRRITAASVSRDFCKKMIHRRDFVGTTRDCQRTASDGTTLVAGLSPSLGDTKGAFPIL